MISHLDNEGSTISQVEDIINSMAAGVFDISQVKAEMFELEGVDCIEFSVAKTFQSQRDINALEIVLRNDCAIPKDDYFYPCKRYRNTLIRIV